MLRNIGVVVALVLLSSTGLAAANNPTWGAKQGANSTVPKLKTVSFCLDNLMWVPATDIGGMGLNINTFTGDVFGCQQVGGANPTKLGTLSWTCTWSGPSISPPADLMVACNGLISLKSGKQATNKGQPLSTAAYSFWTPASSLLNDGTSNVFPQPIGPIVTRSTGSWPAPEKVKNFNWATVSIDLNTPTQLIQVTVEYATKGWNPVSVLAGL